jgi:hypothetical protein
MDNELRAVLQNDSKPWYRQSHLLGLNFCILSCLLFSSANGYDASLMNGLLALSQWNSFMHQPTGAWLGYDVRRYLCAANKLTSL